MTATSTLDLTAAKLTGASPIVFDGATPDSHTVTLALAGDPSSSTTLTIPLETGVLITSVGVGVVTSGMLLDATIVGGDLSSSMQSGRLQRSQPLALPPSRELLRSQAP